MHNSQEFILPDGNRAFAHAPVDVRTGEALNGRVSFRDGPNLDAFGNLRVASGVQLFGATQEYNYGPLLWDHFTAGAGTAVHSGAKNSTTLSTAAATSGARALRQTKLYWRYSPGKSHFVKMTGALRKGGAPAGAAFAGMGYYDDNNGVFFRDSAAGVAVVTRSDTSGSVVNDIVPQSEWNLDTLDGTGLSGITVDWTKEQIFVFDLQWLGVGRVRFGVAIEGVPLYVHEAMHANISTEAYMRTACLPLRGEVFNSGGAGANISMEMICASVDSEAGVSEDDFYSVSYSAYVDAPFTLDTTLRPVVTRRLRDTFGGFPVHGHAHLNAFELLVATNTIYWEIRFNPTVTIGGGGGSVTANVDTTNSISEIITYSGAANTLAGGLLVANGFAAPGIGNARGLSGFSDPGARPLLGRNYDGTRDTYTLSARSLTGAATIALAVQLKEQY